MKPPLYAVLSNVFLVSYSVNKSDRSKPHVKRILGDNVSVQYHLDELCYYLQLGCGVKGVTGVGTTLRLSSIYLKRKRSEMPSIAPFTPLSDQQTHTEHTTPEKAIAALIDVESGVEKGTAICLAIAISPRHLLSSRKCIMDRYLRPWKEQKKGKTAGGRGSTLHSLGIASGDSTKDVEFIAWQRTIATTTQD